MTADEAITALKAGQQLDMSWIGNGARSSKDVWAHTESDGGLTITVYHSISDYFSFFTEEAFREVVDGLRSIWDGDLNDEDDDEDDND